MTPAGPLPEVLDWLRERREEMVALLVEMARLESPTTVPETQGPVFDVMGRELEAVGFAVRRLSGRATGGQLYARPARREHRAPAQLLIGHVDTVWPVGTVERMPVFEEKGEEAGQEAGEERRVVRGPGTFDMKGGLTQLVFALRALDALGLDPEVTPVVFLNSDEETGSPESTGRVRLLARRAARAFVLEPALEPGGRLKTTRRGGGAYRVIVSGRSAHTGLAPEEGASAIQELSFVIQALHGLSDPERGITVNVGEIRGGSRPNVVASDATAVVDARVRTRDDALWLDREIRRIATRPPLTPGTSIRIEGEMGRPPMEPTPGNRALWKAALEVSGELGLEVGEGMSGGGSDGNTTSLFTPTLDGLGAVGDGAHALHEHVQADRMPERAALLAGLLLLPAAAGVPGSDPSRAGAAAGVPASED